MIESYLRPSFQRMCVDPVISGMLRYTSWTPVALTFVAGFVGILSAVVLFLGHPNVACLLIVLSGYLDIVDGSLARARGVDSSKGAVLDIVMDRIVEFSIILGLFYVDPMARALPIIFMLGSTLICVTSFLVVGVFAENAGEKSFHYSAGIMERAEAFFFFILMILLPQWFVLFAWVYTTLVLLTAMIRVFQFFRGV